jgi:hypothetical protein
MKITPFYFLTKYSFCLHFISKLLTFKEIRKIVVHKNIQLKLHYEEKV